MYKNLISYFNRMLQNGKFYTIRNSKIAITSDKYKAMKETMKGYRNNSTTNHQNYKTSAIAHFFLNKDDQSQQAKKFPKLHCHKDFCPKHLGISITLETNQSSNKPPNMISNFVAPKSHHQRITHGKHNCLHIT